MWTLVVLCSVIASYGVRGDNWWTTLAQPEETVTSDVSCGGYLHSSSGTFYSPGYPDNYPDNSECIWYLRFGSGIVQLNFPFISIEDHPSCTYDAIYVYDGFNTAYRLLGMVCGNTTATFHSTGVYMTVRFRSDGIISSSGFRADYRVVAQGSCRYNCGYQVGSCSCSSSCEYRGNCCSDYYDYCLASTPETPSTTGDNWWTVDDVVTDQPSCRYNCGSHMGSCSCSSSCQYYGNCCHDYYYECPSTTTTTAGTREPTHDYFTDHHPSCRYYCGSHMGSCSCEYSCQYYGTCCHDFYYECSETTTVPVTTADNREPTHDYFTDFYPSCRYNCGRDMGMCSCSSSCQYYGNCCHDYYSYCPTFSTPDTTTPGYTSCGGYLYDTSGNFSSPNYPSEYPDNADCIWYIRPGQSVIELRFSSVNIENCTDCICDSISVYDGPDTIFPLLGKVCGGDNATFHSIGTYLTVRFRSDGSVRHTGFQAFYEVVSKGSCRYHCGHQVGACSCYSGCEHTGNCCPDYHAYCSSTTSTPETATPGYTSCGDYLYDSSGNFSSPNFPSAYPYDAECIWYIRPGYSVIELQFSSVNIENCPYCGCDSVSVYDGPSTSSRLLRKVCGGNTVTFHSTGSYLTVRFRTDSSGRHTGFQAFYEVVSQGSCRYNCGYQVGNCSCSSSCEYRGNCCYDYYSYCPSTFSTPGIPTTEYTSCGDYLYGYSGSFSSPNYPTAYPHNADCVWYIRPGYSVIRLWFSSVNIENCGNCGCDSVSVYDGSSTGSSLLGKVCGRNTATFYSTGSYLTVRFSTDGSVSSSGFRAYYEVVDYFSTESPVTEQPSCRYNCGWNLGSCSCTSSCQNYGNCCPDYYDHCSSTTEWPTTEQPSCRYNCGWNLGSCSCSSSCRYNGNCCPDYYNYCSSGTEWPTTATPCGGDLFGSGNFTSPNHPSFYPDDTYCTWRLRASSDQRIFLAFTYLQLENCCECDYIKVYDGSSYMGTVCNNSLASFHSSSNSMTVVFRSDGRVVARGFKAEFISSLPTSSGQVTCSSDNMNIVVQRSYLNSLGYDGDNLYLNNPHCRPQISSSQVIFRFPIEGCGNDKKIENGRVVYSNTLRADTSSYGEITRQVHLKINVACLMDQDSVSHIMYLVEHTGNSSIIGTGKFNTSMNFYTSGNFYYQVTQVPYKVTLNQNLYVQVDLRRQSSNLVIFLDTCVTSPSPHDFESRSYYLIRNGCPVDSTYRPYYTGLRSYARFRFKAFQFLRAAESVYIQCKVLICPASDSNSRCHNPPNCRNRVARDLGTEHDSQTLVLGPIQLRASEKNDEETKEQDEA